MTPFVVQSRGNVLALDNLRLPVAERRFHVPREIISDVLGVEGESFGNVMRVAKGDLFFGNRNGTCRSRLVFSCFRIHFHPDVIHAVNRDGVGVRRVAERGEVGNVSSRSEVSEVNDVLHFSSQRLSGIIVYQVHLHPSGDDNIS